jgi:hypothetical protein
VEPDEDGNLVETDVPEMMDVYQDFDTVRRKMGIQKWKPLMVMSISVRTIVNHKENKREVVRTTARIWRNSMSTHSLASTVELNVSTVQIDDPDPPEKLPCSVHTFVWPTRPFPQKF